MSTVLYSKFPAESGSKEFLKSVNIWQSYCQSLGAWFFWNTVYIWRYLQLGETVKSL